MKRTYVYNCPFCNKHIDPKIDNDVYVSESKRKTVTYFHGECFDRYRKIGFNPIEVDDGK